MTFTPSVVPDLEDLEMSVREPSDSELIERYVKAGDCDAIGDLFTRHAPRAYRTALRLTHNAADAEELVQAAFFQILIHAGNFKSDAGASARAWIMSIVVHNARHNFRDESRRRKNEQAFEALRAESGGENPATQTVLEKLDTLPDDIRLPVCLHYLEGLSFREVAQALNLTENAANKRTLKGLEHLRQALVASGFASAAAALPSLLAAAPQETVPATLSTALNSIAAGKLTVTSGAATLSKGGSAGLKLGLAAKVAAVVVVSTLTAGGVYRFASGSGNGDHVVEAKDDSKPEASSKGNEALLGSPAFMPSTQRPIGWRGDGTGCYPGATPPADWSYSCKHLVSELTTQAKKPGSDKSGKPVEALRAFTDWLILGPFPITDAKEAIAKSFVGDEAALHADAGEKAGELEWRQWTVYPGNQSGQYHSGALDFTAAFGRLTNQVAYAQTYVWSPRDGQVTGLLVYTEAVKFWINNKLVFNSEAMPQAVQHEFPIDLIKGWNRVLVKSAAGTKLPSADGWRFQLRMWIPAAEQSAMTWEAKNIPWVTAMPSEGISLPIIVGDRIFVSLEPYYLVCMNKADGKILWMKHHSNFDAPDAAKTGDNEAATAARAKAKTLLAQLDDVNAKQIAHVSNNSVVPCAVAADANLSNQRVAIEKQLFDLVGAIDQKDYAKMLGAGDQRWSITTPCTDGEYIYTWYMNGVAACYKLDGTRRWIHKEPNAGGRHHGYAASPVLAGGNFVVNVDALKGFDCATGALAWSVPVPAVYSSLSVCKVAGTDCVLTGHSLALFRGSDGKRVSPDFPFHDSPCCSTIVVDNTIITFINNAIEQWRLPAQEGGAMVLMKSVKIHKKLPPTQNKHTMGGWGMPVSSPVYKDGLVYLVTEIGTFSVIDIAKGELVYERWLDLLPNQYYVSNPGICASLAIAGKYLYVMDDNYVTLVLEPGREFKQVARNSLTIGDQSLSTPIFDGSRMYYHGPTWFVCAGER